MEVQKLNKNKCYQYLLFTVDQSYSFSSLSGVEQTKNIETRLSTQGVE